MFVFYYLASRELKKVNKATRKIESKNQIAKESVQVIIMYFTHMPLEFNISVCLYAQSFVFRLTETKERN